MSDESVDKIEFKYRKDSLKLNIINTSFNFFLIKKQLKKKKNVVKI